MPMLSSLHQLFNADTCHAYIHTLRWKDRPLQCPRCHSQHVGPRARTITGRDATAIGAMAVGAPLTI